MQDIAPIRSAAPLFPTSEEAERWQESVRKEWTHPAVAHGYRKWSEAEIAWAQEATDVLLQRAQLTPGLHLLDLASGHGEPSIAAARRVGSQGRVVATDLSLDMLCLALKRALDENLRQFTIEVADAHLLPFPSESFDRVTSRLGVMFFARPIDALREARRVLRPGGRAAFLAWGPKDQPFWETVAGPFERRARLPPADAGPPGPFRFAEVGSLATALEAAGFADVAEEEARIQLRFQGTPSEYWEYWTDTAPPFQRLIEAVPSRHRDEAIEEVLEGLTRRFDGHTITLPATVHVATGGR